MLDPDVLNNPILQGISPEKFDFIHAFSNKKMPTSMNEAMPFMMASIQDAKKKNIQFNNEEVKLISEILIANLSPEEQQKARKILQMMKIC